MQNYKMSKSKKEKTVEEDLYSYLKDSTNKYRYCNNKLSKFSRGLNKIIDSFRNDIEFLRYLVEIHKEKYIKDLEYSKLDKQAKLYMICAIKRRCTGVLQERKLKPV